MQRTSLYRHYDASGRLLYVGVSLAHIRRLCDHRRHSCWYWDIARIEVEHYPTTDDALIAETAAIRAEKPLYNQRSVMCAFPRAEAEDDGVVGEDPASGLLIRLPEEAGERGIAYTVLPDAVDFVDRAKAVARYIGGHGYLFADRGEPREATAIRALKFAQEKGVSIITSAGTLHAGPGGDTSVFLAAFKSAQNVAHVRKSRAKPKKRKPKTEI